MIWHNSVVISSIGVLTAKRLRLELRYFPTGVRETETLLPMRTSSRFDNIIQTSEVI